MLSNSRNVMITGGTLTYVDGRNSSGIDVLYSKVAPGAFHNSGERFDAPKCHPNTRLAIQREILQWLEEASDSLLMWIYGPTGGGKSAIAQTIAQICFERGWLSAAFFFSRRGDPGRSDERKLVPTLAYQLAKHIPETRPYISSAVLDDPSIFDLSIQTQIRELVLTPLRKAFPFPSPSTPLQPRLIIIDGLDECLNQDAQSLIVEEFTLALQEMQQSMPHKLVIASRAEQQLASAFAECDDAQMLKRLSLDSTWRPDDDIRLFLLDSFADIRRKHPLGKKIKGPWPSEADITTLVQKSSGQFIFASTVVNYANSRRHHPVERLKVVRGLSKDPKNPPFAELDSLYRHILLSVEDRDLLLVLLRLSLMPLIGTMRIHLSEPLKVIQYLQDLHESAVELLINELSSVLLLKTGSNKARIAFHHASFPDFLLDSNRAKEFYINNDALNAHLAKESLSFPLRYPDLDFDDFWTLSLQCPVHFLRNISGESGEAFHALGDVDLESVLHIASIQSRNDEVNNQHLPRIFVAFIKYLLRQAERHDSVDLGRTYPLSKLVTKFQEWALTQLRDFPFNGFDNDAGVDITIFSHRTDRRAALHLTSRVMEARVSSILDIMSTVLSIPRVPPPVMTDDMMLCWKFMHIFAGFFDSSDLCGKYAMTPSRSTNAACLCMRYLMIMDAHVASESSHGEDMDVFKEAFRAATRLMPASGSHPELMAHCFKILGLHAVGDGDNATDVLSEFQEQEQRTRLFGRAFTFLENLFANKLPSDQRWQEDDKMLALSLGEAIISYLYRILRWQKRPKSPVAR